MNKFIHIKSLFLMIQNNKKAGMKIVNIITIENNVNAIRKSNDSIKPFSSTYY